MRDWWNNRSRREQLALGVAAAFGVAVLIWALVLLPMADRRASLQARVDAQQATLQQLAEARSLLEIRAATGARSDFGDRSMASVVEQGLRMAGLAASIRRIEPVGDHAVSVTLEQAAFDPLVGWLQTASTEAGILVRELSMEAATTEGTVNTRVQLASAP